MAQVTTETLVVISGAKEDKLAMLSGWEGEYTASLLSITATLANHWCLWAHVCGREHVPLLCCLLLEQEQQFEQMALGVLLKAC